MERTEFILEQIRRAGYYPVVAWFGESDVRLVVAEEAPKKEGGNMVITDPRGAAEVEIVEKWSFPFPAVEKKGINVDLSSEMLKRAFEALEKRRKINC